MKKVFYGWYVVIACMIINAMGTGIFSNIIGLFFPSLIAEFGYTSAQVAGITSIAMFAGIGATGVYSKLYNKYSIRKLVLIFGVLQGASYAAMSFTSNVAGMYGVALFIGIFGMGATALSAPMLTVRWFDKSRGTAMGIGVAGAGLGPAIMAPVVSSVLASSGSGTAFIVLGAMISGAMIVAALLIRDNPEDIGLKPYGQNPGDIKEAKEGKEEKVKVSEASAYSYTVAEASKTQMFYGLMFFIIVICTVVQGILVQVASYFTEVGFDTATVGVYIAAYSFVAGFGKMLIGWVYDNVGVFKANFVFFTLMITSFVCLLLLPKNDAFIYGYIICAGLGLGLTPIAVPLLVSLVFGTEHYGKLYPIFMIMMSVGGICGGVIAGIIIGSGGFSALITACIAGAVLGLVLVQATVIMSKKAQAKMAAK